MRKCRESDSVEKRAESSEDVLAKLVYIFYKQMQASRAQPQPKGKAECVVSLNLPTNVVRYLDYLVQHSSRGASRKSERPPKSRSNLIALAIEETPFCKEKLSEALECCKKWRAAQGSRLVSARLPAGSVQLLWSIASELGSYEKPVSAKAAGEALVFFWSQVHANPKYEEVEPMILMQSVPPLMGKRRMKTPAELSLDGGRTVRLVHRAPRTPVGALAIGTAE